MPSRLLSLITGRVTAWIIVAVGCVVAVGMMGAGGSTRINNDPTAGLPASAQSTQVARLQRRLPSGQTSPALVVYSAGGARLTASELDAITGQIPSLEALALDGRVAGPQVAPNRTAAIVVVPLAADVSTADTQASVKAIRALARSGLPAGMRAQVTGGAAFRADIASAFTGANVTLLLVTVAVVAVLLLITYRSPILWLVPLIVVGFADLTAAGIIALVSRHTSLSLNPGTTGIVQVLVYGAGTDYALLLIARYREELRRLEDRREAMRTALAGVWQPIAASGATVILALLTLAFAQLGNDEAIGIAGAIGIACALVFGLLVLPAALASLPRGIFWPSVPHPEADGRHRDTGRVFRRIGEATARRPWVVTFASILILAVLATGLFGAKLGLSQTQTFRTKSESVAGLQTLSRAFPSGAAAPVAVMTKPESVPAVVRAIRSVPGVAEVRAGERTAAIAEIDVDLRAGPDTSASYDAIRAIRRTVAAVPGASATVGGAIATDLDTRSAALRDFKVIAPLILAVVFLVLVVLLRALVAPLVLIVTVVMSYVAAIGAGNWMFTHIFGFAALDNQVPLLSFLFLIALGVDYNIFLTTRTKEEAAHVGTRRGIIEALAATGGVITSAGILLAAVFTVLGVLPVIVLTEMGIIVGFGVLLDTLLVRTVLVPALIQILGERFWLPSRVVARESQVIEHGSLPAAGLVDP